MPTGLTTGVWDAVSRLRQDEALIIGGKFVAEMSFKQLAERFGTTEDTMRRRVSRIIAKLRKIHDEMKNE